VRRVRMHGLAHVHAFCHAYFVGDELAEFQDLLASSVAGGMLRGDEGPAGGWDRVPAPP
jgi:hypothetical protein